MLLWSAVRFVSPLRTMLLREYPENCRAVIVESAQTLEEAKLLAACFREQEAALRAHIL